MTNAVLEAFTLVTRDGPPHQALRHRPIQDAPEEIHAGMTPDGTRVLIVAVGDDAPRTDDRSSRGVWLLGSPELGSDRVHVLECRDPALDGVFTQLAAELVEALRDVDVDDRWKVLRRRLDQWRQLFVPDPRESVMGREAQTGLWGELAVLRRRLAAGAPDALESWEAGRGRPGPDFRWPGVSMEVKTTTALEGFALRIHGWAQLEPPPSGANLRIAGVRAVAEPDGSSIPDLVSALLDEVDRGELLRRLAARGYQHDPANGGDWIRLSLDSITVWSVDEQTPRLSPEQVPAGWRHAITDVTYTIDAGAMGDALPDVEEVWQ